MGRDPDFDRSIDPRTLAAWIAEWLASAVEWLRTWSTNQSTTLDSLPWADSDVKEASTTWRKKRKRGQLAPADARSLDFTTPPKLHCQRAQAAAKNNPDDQLLVNHSQDVHWTCQLGY